MSKVSHGSATGTAPFTSPQRGEVDLAKRGRVRGFRQIDRPEPPHPGPLPYGERESARLRLPIVAALLLAATLPALAAEIPPDQRRSDYALMGPQTRAMQDDDSVNPGMLWVLDGEALWKRREGGAQKSCADCHGDLASMKGVAARYPAYSAAQAGPIDLEAAINASRARDQEAPPFPFESRELLALTATIALQSRGEPIARSADPRLDPYLAQGSALFHERQGQINLSCAQCHDDNWGQKLAGAVLPQGQPNGYPLYRLEWQSLGSLQRRLRNCMIGMRAEPYAYGSLENVELELYLMQRAAGLKLESPAVRP
jgi:L-cysteine S-thiosulfotransferase